MKKNQSLNAALQFLENIDALKNTYRQCLVMNGERNESTAEHSFSLAMAVLSLGSFSNQDIDLNKAVKMALFHDLAEAILGDVFHYNKQDQPSENQEAIALKKLLEPIKDIQLSNEIESIWHEFEYGQSPEAIFLRGIDRFLPMFHNYKTKGHSWIKHGITKEQALEKNAHIHQSSDEIWNFTQNMLAESKQKGWIL